VILCSWPPDFLPMQEVCSSSYCIGKKARAAISDRYAPGMAPRTGRPRTGQIPNRSLRIPDDLWQAAKERAEREGESISGVVRAYLARYIAEADDHNGISSRTERASPPARSTSSRRRRDSRGVGR
jgi:hypothetical protein